MSIIYKWAEGHDVPSIDLDTITPQPKAQPVAPVVRDYGASPSVHEQGLFVCLEWDFVFEETEYAALLSAINLDSVDVQAVTVQVRNANYTSSRYNGYAHRPQMGVDAKWENTFISSVKIYVTDLELL